LNDVLELKKPFSAAVVKQFLRRRICECKIYLLRKGNQLLLHPRNLPHLAPTVTVGKIKRQMQKTQKQLETRQQIKLPLVCYMM
jgi:hypothetical protein